MPNTDPYLMCECDNCGKLLPYGNAEPAINVGSRLDFGQPYSDVECPECGALMYPLSKSKDTSDAHDTFYLIIALEPTDDPLTDDEKDALVSVVRHGSVEDALQTKASVRVTGANMILQSDLS